MASQKLTLDLTGVAGLAPKSAGDLNDTSPQPQLRYLAQPGQVADGIYDPLRVEGYMSPANNTYTALTGTITNDIISKAYSADTDQVYLMEDGVNLITTSGLNATSVTETTFFTEDSRFRDGEIYQVNGQESLVYTWIEDTPSISQVPNLQLGFISTDRTRGAFQVAAQVFEGGAAIDTQIATLDKNLNKALAQTFGTADFFSTDANTVTGLRLRLSMPFVGVNQTWTLQVSIQSDLSGVPSGSNVAGTVVTMNPNDLPIGSFDYVYFTFTNPVVLSAATAYHIVIKPTVAITTANQGLYWLATANGDGSTIYPNGQAQNYKDGITWTNLDSQTESFDFAIVLNKYNYIGSSKEIIFTNPGLPSVGTNSIAVNVTSTTASGTITTTSQFDPCILIGVVVYNASDVLTAATCGGVAMTLVHKQNASRGGSIAWQYLYYVTGLAAGSHTISVTVSSSSTITILGADYYNVDQTTPVIVSQVWAITDTTASFAESTNVPPPPAGYQGGIPFALGSATAQNGTSSISPGSLDFHTRAQSGSDTLSILGDAGVITGVSSFVINLVKSPTVSASYYVIVGTIAAAAPIGLSTLVPAITEGDDTNVFVHSAQNGFLYLFTNNQVSKFDGGLTGNTGLDVSGNSVYYDAGQFTPNVLTFPSYFKTIDAVDYNNLVYIAIETTNVSEPDYRTFPDNPVGVYSWDYQSILSTIHNYQPIQGARNIKRIFLNAEGDIRVITIGNNRFTEIRGLINGNFEVLFTLGLNAYPLKRGSLDYIDNMCTWLGADGIMYALGTPYKGAKEGVFKIGNTTGLKGAADSMTPSITFVGNKNTTQSLDRMLVAYSTTTSGTETAKLTGWYPHGTGTISTVAQKGNAGGVYSTVLMFPTLAKINYIRLYHAPVGTASTTVKGTIKTYLNQSTTAARTDNITSADISRGYQYIKVGQALKSGMFALQFQINWVTTETLSTTADWMPRMIEVDWEPLTKLF